MKPSTDTTEFILRRALEARGHRFTEQRAAVFRFLLASRAHPTADEVFLRVRDQVPGISLATVYKSLETLVGCDLAVKLTFGDGSARYDGRMDEHHHVRCMECGRVEDLPGRVSDEAVAHLEASATGFRVTGFRLELSGLCVDCEAGSGQVAEA